VTVFETVPSFPVTTSVTSGLPLPLLVAMTNKEIVRVISMYKQQQEEQQYAHFEEPILISFGPMEIFELLFKADEYSQQLHRKPNDLPKSKSRAACSCVP
jgi:hypothetical protein